MPHFLLKMFCLLFPLHSFLVLTKFNSNALNSRKPSRLKTSINPSLASSKKQISPYVWMKNFVNSFLCKHSGNACFRNRTCNESVFQGPDWEAPMTMTSLWSMNEHLQESCSVPSTMPCAIPRPENKSACSSVAAGNYQLTFTEHWSHRLF